MVARSSIAIRRFLALAWDLCRSMYVKLAEERVFSLGPTSTFGIRSASWCDQRKQWSDSGHATAIYCAGLGAKFGSEIAEHRDPCLCDCRNFCSILVESGCRHESLASVRVDAFFEPMS